MITTIKTEIKWALIFTVVLLLWLLGEKIAGLHGQNIEHHATVSSFFFIPAIAVYVFALLDKRKRDYAGVMTYKQGFLSGIIISLILIILSPIAQVIFTSIISPEYFGNAIEYTAQKGLKTRDEAEAYFNLKSYLFQVVISTPIMGIVTAAIVAIFTRKS